MTEELYTPQQTADKLQVSLKSIRKWLAEGKLTGVKVGRLWRIRESDIQQFLERNAK